MKFDHVVVVIQKKKGLANLRIENLYMSLILHDQRFNIKLEDTQKDMVEKALQTKLNLKGDNEIRE